MKTIKDVGAQGDLLFVRQAGPVPPGAKPIDPMGGRFILARGDSASGDHSVTANGVKYFSLDDRSAYLVVDIASEVVHGRAVDAHESVMLSHGTWLVRRQREHTPEGFRRVED